MATAVIDLDLASAPTIASIPVRYTAAHVIVRYRGRPVGSVLLSASTVRAEGALRRALEEAGGEPLRRARLEEWLGWPPLSPLDRPAAPSTVCVCTRDRPDDLARCLASLRRMPNDGQEILVIDSASSTGAVEEAARGAPGVRYVREERPGLNRARNRGLREARHGIVAFTDDDAAPEPGWLRALARGFDDRLVYATTGLTLPLELETRAQEWQERLSSFGRGYARRVFDGTRMSPAMAGHAGAGVNMAVRRAVLGTLGPFDEALDAGTRTRSGGDTEMFSRILGRGLRVVYEPEAVSRHRHRREWSETREAIRGYGVGTYAAWTRALLVEKESTVLYHASAWFFKHQLPGLFRSLFRLPGSAPLDLVLAELSGCAAGPLAYLREKRECAR